MRSVLFLLVCALALAASACRTAPEAAPTPVPATPPVTPPPATATPAPTEPPDPFQAAAALLLADASSLATTLREAESAIREGPADEDAAAVGLRQQAAYRQLVEQPGWRTPVLDAMPAPLRGAVEENLSAAVELRALTRPREDLPHHWRIVAPAPADELAGFYRAASEEFGVGWEYLAAIHLIETRMGRIRGTSVAGAQGPMQFLPSTWERYGEGDITSNRDAIRAAARYLVANGAPQDMGRALFAYNRSQRYVSAIESYAAVMRADESAYVGYYHWQVFYRTTRGDALLWEGWPDPRT